ncbi:Uncharacterized protein Adt_09828 [Abeliophyllum distichum]|uniref:FHA domain-containing protein n=1 Tax=Abeliophyllum distichum TaxID=126358 RepID=A0ABD1UI99_9LAMI
MSRVPTRHHVDGKCNQRPHSQPDLRPQILPNPRRHRSLEPELGSDDLSELSREDTYPPLDTHIYRSNPLVVEGQVLHLQNMDSQVEIKVEDPISNVSAQHMILHQSKFLNSIWLEQVHFTTSSACEQYPVSIEDLYESINPLVFNGFSRKWRAQFLIEYSNHGFSLSIPTIIFIRNDIPSQNYFVCDKIVKLVEASDTETYCDSIEYDDDADRSNDSDYE